MSDAERVRRLYEQRPYPPPEGGARRVVLSAAWVDGSVHPAPSVFRSGARCLVAGCGSGEEAVALAAGLPGVDVVGVDFSAAAIARGQAAGHGERVQLVCADLCDPALPERLGQFDLVICNAVADYIPDSAALFHGLSAMLAADGVLNLAVNHTFHPRERVLRALAALGHAPDAPPADAGLTLGVLARLMGDHAGGYTLDHLPESILAVDLFPPFAHHRTLGAWAGLAAVAGLHLHSASNTSAHLAQLADDALPVLFPLTRAALALLIDGLRFEASARALFTRRPPQCPPWASPAAFAAWRVQAAPALHGLPEITGGWEERRAVQVADEHATHAFGVAAPALNGLRSCPTPRLVGAVWAECPPALMAGLFRLWNANLVWLAPP